jgi:hypothetical protein
MMERKESLFKSWTRGFSIIDSYAYEAVCYDLHKCQTEFLKKYEKKLACKSNSKSFYRYANSRMKSRFSFPVMKNNQNERALTASDKAMLLNKFFGSVYTIDDGTLPAIPFVDYVCDREPDFSVLNIYRLLSKCDNTLVSGPDGIAGTFCKTFAAELALPLSILYECSYKFSEVPRDWRDANITPLHKKSSKAYVENYRDINLVCNFSKPLEIIINKVIVDFCLEKDIFSRTQHAYLLGRSTSTNLLLGLKDWVRAIDEGNFADVVFLDLKKAFNSVPHAKLLYKLDSLGIRGKLLNWIKVFLKERRQRVRVENRYSEFIEVSSGVPQGSVLGPTLFLLYINDLPLVLSSSKVLMYADDVKIYMRVASEFDCNTLSRDLGNIESWTRRWQLSLAVDKCFVMRFANRKGDTDSYYKLGTHELPFVEKTKDLGIMLTSDLKFHEHTDYIVKKALRTINLISYGFCTEEKDILLRLYKTYVLPILSYGSVVWNPCFRGDRDKLERCQKVMLRRILPDESLSYNDRIQKLDILTLEESRILADLVFMYNLLHERTFLNPEDFVQSHVSVYSTRGHNMKLVVPKFRLTQQKHFFSNRTVSIWNQLPPEIVNIATVKRFKTEIRKWLITERVHN